MNTFQLTCFLAVAEYLSFAQAAQQLHVTHPAVSQQIKSLEKELNVTLFQRTTRSVKLTEEGRAFLRDAQQIVAISDRAKKRFDGALPGTIETLALGCYNFPSLFLLTDTLGRLREVRPGVHPRLQVIPFQHIYQMLQEGDLDGVVGFKEPPSVKIKGVYKEFVKVPLVCACPKQDPLSQQPTVSLADLKDQLLVSFAPSRASLSLAQLHGQLIGGRAPSQMYFCESAEAITVLVSAGYGVSILPDFLVPEAAEITKIPLTGVDPLSFGIYYKSLQNNPTLKAFIQEARACLGDLPSTNQDA